MNINPLALARLQQLISPSLPIGAFTYSQGMEYAHEAGWLKTREDVYHWLSDVLTHNLANYELPLIYQISNAINQALTSQDWSDVEYLIALNLAGRETSELRMEEQQRGQALYNVLIKLADPSQQQILHQQRPLISRSFLAGFALSHILWNIPIDATLCGYAFSFIENMVSVCVKLIPLGQSDGQNLIYNLSNQIEEICLKAKNIDSNDIGGALPAMAIASSKHENQYCRLFRS